MRNFTLSALALASALTAGAAVAQPSSAAYDQLAAAAGVSGEGYSVGILQRLVEARRDNDLELINLLKAQRNSDVTRSDMGGTTGGAAQFAATLGVEPGRYSVNELARLERAIANEEEEEIDFILSGTIREQTSAGANNPGTVQLASILGLNAGDYTLSELSALSVDHTDEDDN